MTRRCAAHSILFPLVAMAGLGCQVSTPMPVPDAALAGGVTLLATPSPPSQLVIRPGSTGRIRFEVRDEANQPLVEYPIEFAIKGAGDGGEGTAGAKLSTQRCLTGPGGVAVVEVMVGALANGASLVSFQVEATCPGAPKQAVEVLVTTNAYSVEILPVPADDLLGLASVATTRLYFYDNFACGNIDIYDYSASITQARAPHPVDLGASYVFKGVAATGVHAVLGLGMDSAGTVQIGGCVDVPGVALLEPEIVRATLLLDHLFPALSGTYRVASEFHLTPAPAALPPILTAWQQWARCPFDPARLWLDCTIAALAAEPNTCVPVASKLGVLGNLLLSSRGTVVPPLAGTTSSATDTPCRGATDSNGNTSLDAAVDALFSSARTALAELNLGGFPGEIMTLVNAVRLDSQMTIAPAGDPSSFWLDHGLVAVTFPNAIVPSTLAAASFTISDLGLPLPTSSGALATFKMGQFFVPSHGFTLRLGTDALYAFEASSLALRKVAGSRGLVEQVFALAKSSDQTTPLTGCAAMDAVVCSQIKRSRGCVAAACQSGLVALTANLAAAFKGLDGDGLDFSLYGSAPVIDLDADGRADALGTTGAPGLWSADIAARGGSYVAYGSWSAKR
jgi:hypothetical protein